MESGPVVREDPADTEEGNVDDYEGIGSKFNSKHEEIVIFTFFGSLNILRGSLRKGLVGPAPLPPKI